MDEYCYRKAYNRAFAMPPEEALYMESNLPRKTVVVTGANAGLGFAITQALLQQDYRVVMACRNAVKASAARMKLLEHVPGADVSVLPLDVSELDSVEAFAKHFEEQFRELDLLINNAGIVAMPLTRNDAGHEMQMATNYLGNFALVGRMLPFFITERPCRIVNVGSLAHRFGKMPVDDMNWTADDYKPMKGYARSKVALLSFTQELNRRLEGTNIIALAAHPGFAATEITAGNAEMQPKNAIQRWVRSKVEPLIPTPAEAARSILHAALAEDVRGGDYFGPGGFFEIAGKPAMARLNPVTKDVEDARRLWSISQDMTGVCYLDADA
jgi:NAD(P)-dependent dehydrogenase (short-subunit alcohol dehydrogenase family)